MITSLYYMYYVHVKINYGNIQTTYTQLLLLKKKKNSIHGIKFCLPLKNTILNIVYQKYNTRTRILRRTKASKCKK